MSTGIVAFLHFVIGVSLYFTLRTDGRFSVPFMGMWGTKIPVPSDWLYLFSAWDTGHYIGIAQSWYTPYLSLLWAFFPLYPASIRFLGLLGIDDTLSAFIVAVSSGLLSVIIFQRIAEHYFGQPESFNATLLYFLLPPVFVFSIVSYTEPLFLLLSMLAWEFHLNSRDSSSSVAAALASLTRTYGIFIILPMAYDFIRRQQFSKLKFLLVPALTFGAWISYGFIMTGVWFAPMTAQRYWETSNSIELQRGFAELLAGNFAALSSLSLYYRVATAGIVFMVFILYLSWRVLKIDRALGLYLFCSIAAITYFAILPAYLSFPRFLTLLFPIGFALKIKSGIVLVLLIAVLFLLDYVAWWAFLTQLFH